MGNQQPTKKPQPRINIQDALIDMKIQSKQVMRAATKSEKQSQQYMKKARQALKKNNQDGAKLYLVSASQKKNESLNFQRTGVKMDIMCDRIKSMKANEELVNTFGKMTQVINQQMNQIDAVKMAQSMDMLNTQMDNMMINNKMMGQIMQQNQVTDNATVDQMMNVLKQELTMQNTNDLNVHVPQQQQVNYNQNNQRTMLAGGNNGTNPNPKGGMKQQQSHDPFLDQLKDL